MTQFHGSVGWPEDFCGKVRLFPLSNLVMFPQVVQPLHIFEPRYCEMLDDAMRGDRLIAMALLKNGWEQKLHKPAIDPTVCIGKVIADTPTEDGRHNILLVGMKRARITEEISVESSFRVANVQTQEDYYPHEEAGVRPELTETLQTLFSNFVPDGLAAQESFEQLVGQELPLGILTDTITYALNLPLAVKQQLLAEFNVDIRCRILIRCLEQQLSRVQESCSVESEEFPPKFSQN